MRKLAILACCATLLLGCSPKERESQAEIVVSIAPLKYIVERIIGDDFRIGVLVPANTSPETYDPTPRDIISLNNAQMVFSTGLIEFENALLGKVSDKQSVVNLHEGIELIAGSCSHSHCNHAHGVDPHIWLSPRELRTMSRNAHTAIMRLYPDSAHYTSAYNALDEELAALDEECRTRCEASSADAFVIYHPALTYYARAYSLEQIAIESDGKEPSAKHIAGIIARAKQQHATCLLYQSEFPRSVVEVIAKDMGIEPIEINPLAENPVAFIREVTNTITK